LYLAEGQEHEWDDENTAQIFGFLFRDRSQNQMPIKVHPRIVTTPTANQQRVTLPQNVPQLTPGSQAYIELWVEAPQGVPAGVKSGILDLYVDEDVATINAGTITHGDVFNINTGHEYNATSPSFVRGFNGTTAQSGVGQGEFALFGRVGFTALSLATSTQLLAGLVRSAGSDFVLMNGTSHRTDFMPLPKTYVARDNQGIQGTLFEDKNGNGVQDHSEPGVAGQKVLLRDASGSLVSIRRHVEPDEHGDGAYLNSANPWVALSSEGSLVLSTGVRSDLRDSSSDASTGRSIFQTFTSQGVWTTWEHGERALRMDFSAPATRVTIDIISNSSSDTGRLDVFDASGQLLESVTSPSLSSGQSAQLVISRPVGDIAYAVAAGDDDTVRLDNLTFDINAIVVSDPWGHYRFPDVDTGSYSLVAELPSGWSSTVPSTGQRQVTIAEGQFLGNQHFGMGDNTAPVLTGFSRQAPAASPTNADMLVFRAMFDEAVQNVDTADFAVTGTTAGITDVVTVNAST
jgi:hypothetical protein